MPEKQKTIRKLRAIFSADVKGYSRMMEKDETSTIKRLNEYRLTMSELVQQHTGRVVDAVGDNLLAEFSSAVNAVQCAVDIQKDLKDKNRDLPEDNRLEFRIGINIGDVVQEGNRIYGSGVNVAARLEGLADPGGISISRNAYDQIKGKLNLGYQYLGDHEVKNIKEPVHVYKVLMDKEDVGKVIGEKQTSLIKTLAWSAVIVASIMVISYLFIQKPTAPEFEPASVEKMAHPLPDKPSIAVLAFDNMSGDPEQEYFSDGISENIMTTLSKTDRLLVIARNSTFRYKGKSVDIKKIAEELGVRYVLEGSVQKSENKVRITAQLIDAVSGNHLWAERYDRDIKDIFTLQDEITMKIVTALQVKLTEGDQAYMWSKQTDNIDVYLKFLEVISVMREGGKEGIMRMGQLGKEIVDMAPDSVVGYRVLGWYNYHLANMGVSPKKSIEKAFDLAQKGLSIDETNSGIHALLSSLYLKKKQYEKAIEVGKRSIELNPNGAMVHGVLGVTLSYAGRTDEAIGYLKKGIRLDPFPASWYYSNLGRCYRHKGEYENALTYFEKAAHLVPGSLNLQMQLASVYVLLDRQEEAEIAAKKVLEIDPDFSLTKHTKLWPNKNQAHIKLYVDALRKAGLPD